MILSIVRTKIFLINFKLLRLKQNLRIIKINFNNLFLVTKKNIKDGKLKFFLNEKRATQKGRYHRETKQ